MGGMYFPFDMLAARRHLVSRLWPLFLLLGLPGCSRAVTNYANTPGPRFVGSPAGLPPAGLDGGLRVVTWNVKWGGQPEAAAELLATHERLRAADLVLLQGVREKAVATIAQRLGLGYVVTGDDASPGTPSRRQRDAVSLAPGRRPQAGVAPPGVGPRHWSRCCGRDGPDGRAPDSGSIRFISPPRSRSAMAASKISSGP